MKGSMLHYINVKDQCFITTSMQKDQCCITTLVLYHEIDVKDQCCITTSMQKCDQKLEIIYTMQKMRGGHSRPFTTDKYHSQYEHGAVLASTVQG